MSKVKPKARPREKEVVPKIEVMYRVPGFKGVQTLEIGERAHIHNFLDRAGLKHEKKFRAARKDGKWVSGSAKVSDYIVGSPLEVFENGPELSAYTVFTNLSIESLVSGDIIDIDETSPLEEVKMVIEGLLRALGVELPRNFELHVFLPGGVPFLSGTLKEWQEAMQVRQKNLYVVVTRDLGKASKSVIKELGDFSSDMMKNLLSPLYESTPAGLAQVAALLGYCQHDGPKTEDLLLLFAQVTGFAPMVCSLFRIMEHENITGLDVVAITGVLPTLLNSIPKTPFANESVLEHALKLVSTIMLLERPPFLKLVALNWNEKEARGTPLGQYCNRTKQQKHIVFWLKDIAQHEEPEETDFVGKMIQRLDDDSWQDVFTYVPALKPLAPASARVLFSVAILKGVANPLVFLGHVRGNHNIIKYLDPANGKQIEQDIDILAKEVGDTTIDGTAALESQQVNQVIEVLFDESSSMNTVLDSTSGVTRIQGAKECLRAFKSRTIAYRVASVFGIISFGSTVVERCALSPLVSDFETGLDAVTAKGTTHLWEAISIAVTKICNYTKPGDGKDQASCGAHKRVLVISDGDDCGSKEMPWDVVNLCIANNIVVDSVLLNASNAQLPLFCEMTGGLTLTVTNIDQGLCVFEQEAFLNHAVRVRAEPHKGTVTEEYWKQRVESFSSKPDVQQKIPNKETDKANAPNRLISPKYASWLSIKENPPEGRRMVRITSEIRYVANRPNQDYQVWINKWDWDEWRVFIRGPAGTPYEGLWWSLHVSFPESYPVGPPNIRFLSIPYHPNVSDEGKLLFDMIDDDYNSNIRVHEIIVAIVKLLSCPELDHPIQPRIAEMYKNRTSFNCRVQHAASEQAKKNIGEYPYFNAEKDPPDLGNMTFDDMTNTQLQVTQRTAYHGKALQVDDDQDYYL